MVGGVGWVGLFIGNRFWNGLSVGIKVVYGEGVMNGYCDAVM